jgi:phosphatidylserine decarboxylase
VDVLLPAAANLKVKTGMRVRGGSSVLAEIAEPVGQKAVSAAAVVA